MKILYFHQHFQIPAQAGGTRSYELARGLIARGHEVCMVCGEVAKLDLSPTKISGIYRGNIDGIDVIQISLPYSNKDGIIKRTRTFIKFAYKGIRIALKEKYDLLFATSTPLTAGIPGIIAKWFRKKKFVFEVRDLWPEIPKALGLKNPLLLWGMSFLEWLTYRSANACIGLSPGICEGIAKRSSPGKRIIMLPNGCDLDLFFPGDQKEPALEGIQPTDITAVFTGTHGVANGLDAILDAAGALINKNRHDIKLVFIGDGKVKPRLIERATVEKLTNCCFYDPMPKIELAKVISNTDVGLMVLADSPAFYYGTSPNKFFDYLSAGIPVLNNYRGWLADMINENECGIVVPANDPEAFADALIALADDPEQRKHYGENARKLAERNFSRYDIASNFVDFIEEI
ncbi:MAG: glycosyltransferase family 4 protein [Tannerella sp.]|jgi:glycosyltransferase involved in cell wall biosynthesis|nr:glycosyltransferase family 4 protein [Tannerella sp.]